MKGKHMMPGGKMMSNKEMGRKMPNSKEMDDKEMKKEYKRMRKHA